MTDPTPGAPLTTDRRAPARDPRHVEFVASMHPLRFFGPRGRA